ncbi:thiamine pyrophosphate-dependent enzyme, partial [Otariodibacter sp.]|uniref:thiamine pyrophosphate-dependent enzyme n=1 Tax=Otariodibacter sp. TaxID=3030919 RepID=UPI002639CF84
NVPGIELPGIDMTEIAKGYGCNSSRVNSVAELDEAIKKALSDPHVHLIDVHVDPGKGQVY